MAARVRKSWISVVLAIFLVATALPAMGATVPVFGPKEYVRTEGAPNTYSGVFALPANVTGCRLLVSYGKSGPLTANNFSLTVNGKEMINGKSIRDSNPADQTVELLNENTIFITLKGKPGDSVVVQVVGERHEAPGGGGDNPPPVVVPMEW